MVIRFKARVTYSIRTGTQVMPSSDLQLERIETLSCLFTNKILLLSYQLQELKISRMSPF